MDRNSTAAGPAGELPAVDVVLGFTRSRGTAPAATGKGTRCRSPCAGAGGGARRRRAILASSTGGGHRAENRQRLTSVATARGAPGGASFAENRVGTAVGVSSSRADHNTSSPEGETRTGRRRTIGGQRRDRRWTPASAGRSLSAARSRRPGGPPRGRRARPGGGKVVVGHAGHGVAGFIAGAGEPRSSSLRRLGQPGRQAKADGVLALVGRASPEDERVAEKPVHAGEVLGAAGGGGSHHQIVAEQPATARWIGKGLGATGASPGFVQVGRPQLAFPGRAEATEGTDPRLATDAVVAGGLGEPDGHGAARPAASARSAGAGIVGPPARSS